MRSSAAPLPTSPRRTCREKVLPARERARRRRHLRRGVPAGPQALPSALLPLAETAGHPRSEEHTSELQSRGHLVCRLLLEKKKEKELWFGDEKRTGLDTSAHAAA